jgi:hypothetical protein
MENMKIETWAGWREQRLGQSAKMGVGMEQIAKMRGQRAESEEHSDESSMGASGAENNVAASLDPEQHPFHCISLWSPPGDEEVDFPISF